MGNKFLDDPQAFITLDAFTHDISGQVSLEQITQATKVTKYKVDIDGLSVSDLLVRFIANGQFDTVGSVDKIKFRSHDPITGGTIHHLKRLF